MKALYEDAAEVQECAAEWLNKHPKYPKKAIKIISVFAYNTAMTWHEDWEKLGDKLLSKYWVVQGTSASELPNWWLDVINYEPPVRE
jgi:hypothetical protein